MNKKKLNNYIKSIRPLAILMVMILILTVASVAWIRREWTPYLSSGKNGISIATQDALVFNLADDDTSNQETSTSKTINSILGVETFELKPVSCMANVSNDFYKLNYGTTPSEHQFIKITGTGTSMQTGINNGYIDINFRIASNDKAGTQFVYLHKESHIGTPGEELKDSDKAIRVAITVVHSGSSGPTKYVFSAEGEDRVNNVDEQTTYKAIWKEGFVYSSYDDISGIGVRNQDCISELINLDNQSPVKKFSDFIGHDANDVEDTSLCLFSIPQGGVDIRVQIWLEGEDEHCTEKILSENVDLLIKFAAFTKEDDK